MKVSDCFSFAPAHFQEMLSLGHWTQHRLLSTCLLDGSVEKNQCGALHPPFTQQIPCRSKSWTEDIEENRLQHVSPVKVLNWPRVLIMFLNGALNVLLVVSVRPQKISGFTTRLAFPSFLQILPSQVECTASLLTSTVAVCHVGYWALGMCWSILKCASRYEFADLNCEVPKCPHSLPPFPGLISVSYAEPNPSGMKKPATLCVSFLQCACAGLLWALQWFPQIEG